MWNDIYIPQQKPVQKYFFAIENQNRTLYITNSAQNTSKAYLNINIGGKALKTNIDHVFNIHNSSFNYFLFEFL